MSSYLQASIQQAEQDHLDAKNERIERAGEYADGYCSCCGSDDGLDEDGFACGYCAEGRLLLEKEKQNDTDCI